MRAASCPGTSRARIGISACGQPSWMRTSRARMPPMNEEDDAGEQELDADDLVVFGKMYLRMKPSSG